MKTSLTIKTILPALAVSALIGLWPSEAVAAPFTSTLGVSGLPPAANRIAFAVDLDVGPSGSPWGFMGSYQAEVSGPGKPATYYTNPQVLSSLLRYRTATFGEDSLTLFAGLNYYQDSSVKSDPGFRLSPNPLEPLIGFTYTLRNDRLWISLSPYYLYSPQRGAYGAPWFFMTGMPLIEAGFALTPKVDLSLRLAFTPIRLSYRF